MKRSHILLILATILVALPGLAIRLLGIHLGPAATVVVAGLSITSASFLLAWACDAAQADIPQALALAVVALIAVLPEYAVDMYFTWQAGRFPESRYAHYAIANMTGANRLLIGVAWAAVVFLFWIRHRAEVWLEKERRTELFFLAAATVYALIIPLKGSLAWYDGLVFLGLYAWYILISSRRPVVECECEGPAELLSQLRPAHRRAITILLFLFSAGVIVANAEPFCEGLIATGRLLRINEFLLVQWLAPIASEAPEFVVALIFAWRGQPSVALGALLSSKLNQWTLLVGMIPGVFAVSHGSLAHPIPMDHFQMGEMLLTACQSVLGIALLASLRLSLGGALLLFGLFIGQLLLPGVVPQGWVLSAQQIHPVFCALYITAAASVVLPAPRQVWNLIWGVRGLEEPERLNTPHCATCRFRLMATSQRPK